MKIWVIDSTFEASKDEIVEQLFIGATKEMTEQEAFSKMILNSMRISAILAVLPMIVGLVQTGIIPKDVLEKHN